MRRKKRIRRERRNANALLRLYTLMHNGGNRGQETDYLTAPCLEESHVRVRTLGGQRTARA